MWSIERMFDDMFRTVRQLDPRPLIMYYGGSLHHSAHQLSVYDIGLQAVAEARRRAGRHLLRGSRAGRNRRGHRPQLRCTPDGGSLAGAAANARLPAIVLPRLRPRRARLPVGRQLGADGADAEGVNMGGARRDAVSADGRSRRLRARSSSAPGASSWKWPKPNPCARRSPACFPTARYSRTFPRGSTSIPRWR